METPTPRWQFLGTSAGQDGLKFFTLSRRGAIVDDQDYEELTRVLQRQFGAVETGELRGPYSTHKYLELDGIRIGLILDSPDWFDLYPRDERDRPVMEWLVAKILDALNGHEKAPEIHRP